VLQSVTPKNLQDFINIATNHIVAIGLGAARTSGIVMILPVFTRAQIGGVLRGALALALALPISSYAIDSLSTIDGAWRLIRITLLAIKEVFVGVLIGYLVGLPFWSIQSVGELVDTQRGITSEVAPVDPATRSQASAMGLFLGVTTIAIFVVSGGLQTLVETLYRSYAVWPLDRFAPKLTVDGALQFAGMLDHVLKYTFLVAGPVLVFLLLIDLSVMLIGRFAPQLRAYDLAPTVKNVGFIFFIIVYAVYLIEYMGSEIVETRGVGDRLERFTR
jgi:type III secretion protein T